MGLNVYTSNRMELLAEALAGTVSGPIDPFIPETIVVQSKGMQRWLSMQLAQRFGVWANCSYPFPNSYVWELFRKVLPGDTADRSPFEPEALAWSIMAILPGLLEQDGFEIIRRYLAGGQGELKLFQLAAKIADTFDQYTLFREDMLAGWERGSESHWQASLWRILVNNIDGKPLHRAAVKRHFLEVLARGGQLDVPERICVFGVSFLPKFHLDVLSAVATRTEVNLFVMSPCREYWADILPARSLVRLSPAESEHRIEGNPLLASMGRMGREFCGLIIDCSTVTGGSEDLYRETPGETLLELLQNDILTLSGGCEGLRDKVTIPSGDRTIQFHSCHSPMRELEALHDTLLAMFSDMDGLAPRDILVMTPDIEHYAPYISAVFEGNPEEGRRIPYSIADRSVRSEGRSAEALLAILNLPGRRFPVTGVMDILSTPAIASRFGLGPTELDRVRSWLEETRVRWGFDEHERVRAGFPRYRDNSWRAGLDRLLLGYAMADDGVLFNGILPFDAMEGDAAETLGRFVRFVEELHQVIEALDQPRTLAEWAVLARAVVAGFFAPGEEGADELEAINALLDDAETLPERSGFSGTIGLPVFRTWLSEGLGRRGRGLGFMTGGVTFCAMLPMRSIPFRVIALLGMNDDMFPRRNTPPGFDLMARDRRPGDRSLRDEDRYLFLETVLSARDRLIISYTGQSIRDNAQLPPSVLVEELLDYLAGRFSDGTDDFPSPLVTRHRLQPFSPAYFAGGGQLFSFYEENYRAVYSRAAGISTPPPFFAGPLPEPPELLKDVSIGSLLAFFDHPVRYLLRTRLGIRLDDLAPPLEDREPFALAALDAYQIRQQLLELAMAGADPHEHRAVAKAQGVLPPARQGDLHFTEIVAEADRFAAAVREQGGSLPVLAPLDVDLELGGIRLTGRLEGVRSGRLLRYRCAKRSGRDQIRLWVEHLVLNAAGGDDYPRSSALVTTDGVVELAPVGECSELLAMMLDLFRLGLATPLKFFPRASFAYAKRWDLAAARSAWSGNQFPEGDDPYHRLCFGTSDPLDGEFERIAHRILEPFQRCRVA